jgi:16S rRNA (adenine1518-N6/adenine1519-N6)-dimethyltransferase
VDENFLRALADDLKLGPEEDVVEIGSGPGSLTAHLALRARQVWAFEIDPGLLDLAREALADRPNVTFVLSDGASFDLQVHPPGPFQVVSNLPYSDWQRLTLRILSTRLPVSAYVLMVQKDVYERIRARPGTRDYGPIGVLLGGTCEIRKLREAGRRLFWPVPGVDSVVLLLRRRTAGLDYVRAFRGLQALFAHRRKKSPAAGGRRIEELPPAELLGLLSEGRDPDPTPRKP